MTLPIPNERSINRYAYLETCARDLAKDTVRYEIIDHEHDDELAWEPEWPELTLTGSSFGETAGGDPRLQLHVRLNGPYEGEWLEAVLGDYDGVDAMFNGERVGLDYLVRNAIGSDTVNHNDRAEQVEDIAEALVAIFERYNAIYRGALYFSERATSEAAAEQFGQELALAHRHAGEVTVSMDEIVEHLTRRHGIFAYVEQTGGGIATIYAGRYTASTEDSDLRGYDGHWDAVAGPGWFAGPAWTKGTGNLADFYIGPDDDGENVDAIYTTNPEEDTARSIADRMATMIVGLDR